MTADFNFTHESLSRYLEEVRAVWDIEKQAGIDKAIMAERQRCGKIASEWRDNGSLPHPATLADALNRAISMAVAEKASMSR